jgi:hypothetical protein
MSVVAVPWLLPRALKISRISRCKNEVLLTLDLDGTYLGIHCILISAAAAADAIEHNEWTDH